MKVLLNAPQVQDGVARMARQIEECYGGRPLTIVGVMTGSIVLLADLIRLLQMPLRVGVIQASSYRGHTQRGNLLVNADLMLDISQREVLVIDDIFDTGHTLVRVVSELRQFEPASLRTAVLLRKQGRSEVNFQPDFVAFEIPDVFVVGYGLDYRDEYRNLPYVGELEDADLVSRPSDG